MECCKLCDRSFSDRQAFQQHMRDAPVHTLTFRCDPCNRTFVNRSALDQHIRDSPVHIITYDCEPCSRSFGSQSALDQHIQHSKAHIAPTSTPLDKFFRSFPGFRYNPKLPPSESYAQLREFRGWGKEDPDEKKAWKRYQSALEAEVKMWFGAEDDLEAWHSLCRAIGIGPLPATCKQAVKVSTYLACIFACFLGIRIGLQQALIINIG